MARDSSGKKASSTKIWPPRSWPGTWTRSMPAKNKSRNPWIATISDDGSRWGDSLAASRRVCWAVMETPEEGSEKPAPANKPEDERSYEDNWYQVLRRRKAQEENDD